MSEASQALENLLKEERTFPPPAAFAAASNGTKATYDAAGDDWLGFWRDQALTRIAWFEEPTVVLDDSDAPFYRWFSDGVLNLSYNCLDRHLDTRGDKVAFHWIGEPGDTRTITYRDLYEEVGRFANALKSLGVERGDRVAIYMGMIPELPVAMLACARIGAVHSVVFGGFSSESLADRIDDAAAKVLITQDGAWRRGSVVSLKANADVSVARCPTIEHTVVVRRTDNEVHMGDVDHWYHDLVADQPSECPPEPMNAEDLLYILYTSGTTGKPKGIVHTQGGYLTGVTTTHHYVFDIKGRRRLLVRRRHRMGDRPLIHRVRPAGQRRHRRDVRGRTGLPRQGPAVGDHRGVRRHHLLHRPDRDPGVHEMGRRLPRGTRPVVAAAPRDGRGADQPRSVDVVPRAHRRGAVPDRRHLVADRDRRHHDHAATRGRRHEARIGDVPVPRDRRGRGRRRRQLRTARRRRLSHHHPALAGDAAHRLRRRPTVPRHVLVAVRRSLLPR